MCSEAGLRRGGTSFELATAFWIGIDEGKWESIARAETAWGEKGCLFIGHIYGW